MNADGEYERRRPDAHEAGAGPRSAQDDVLDRVLRRNIQAVAVG